MTNYGAFIVIASDSEAISLVSEREIVSSLALLAMTMMPQSLRLPLNENLTILRQIPPFRIHFFNPFNLFRA